jgi:putative transcriptional regulator
MHWQFQPEAEKGFENRFAPAPGRLLIAHPFLQDPNFMRTVILLTDHSPEGTVGYVLNRPLDITVSQAVDSLDHFHEALYYGGPLHLDTLHYIHTFKHLKGGIPILPDVYWNGNFDILSLITEHATSQEIRFFCGYSGWAPGQLQHEIIQQAWIISEANNTLIFDTPPEHLWKSALIALGNPFAQFANYPISPLLN